MFISHLVLRSFFVLSSSTEEIDDEKVKNDAGKEEIAERSVGDVRRLHVQEGGQSQSQRQCLAAMAPSARVISSQPHVLSVRTLEELIPDQCPAAWAQSSQTPQGRRKTLTFREKTLGIRKRWTGWLGCEERPRGRIGPLCSRTCASADAGAVKRRKWKCGSDRFMCWRYARLKGGPLRPRGLCKEH